MNLNKIKRNPHQQPTKFKSLFTSPSYYEYIEKANEYEGHIGKKIWVPHFSGLEKTNKIKKRNKKRENIKGYSYTHDFSSHQDRLDFIVSKRRGKDKETPHETKAAFGWKRIEKSNIHLQKQKKKEDIPFHNKNPYLLILSFSHSQIVTKLKKKNTPKKKKKKKDENKVKRKKKVLFSWFLFSSNLRFFFFSFVFFFEVVEG